MARGQNGNQSNSNFMIKLKVQNKEVKKSQMKLHAHLIESQSRQDSVERKIRGKQLDSISETSMKGKHNRRKNKTKIEARKSSRLNERLRALNSTKGSSQINQTQNEGAMLFKKRYVNKIFNLTIEMGIIVTISLCKEVVKA